MSLPLRNLIFVILHPGVVTVLVPYLLLGKTAAWNAPPLVLFGVLLISCGTLILGICIFQFGDEGKGTLSPFDPTKVLVTRGVYRYSRNPMYVSVAVIMAGECLLFNSRELIWYTVSVVIGFHLFVIWHEEPRLKRDFGEAYEAYARKVRRWM